METLEAIYSWPQTKDIELEISWCKFHKWASVCNCLVLAKAKKYEDKKEKTQKRAAARGGEGNKGPKIKEKHGSDKSGKQKD